MGLGLIEENRNPRLRANGPTTQAMLPTLDYRNNTANLAATFHPPTFRHNPGNSANVSSINARRSLPGVQMVTMVWLIPWLPTSVRSVLTFFHRSACICVGRNPQPQPCSSRARSISSSLVNIVCPEICRRRATGSSESGCMITCGVSESSSSESGCSAPGKSALAA